jgi:hypothetical protein
MALYRPQRIPSEGVDASGVAVATSVQLRRAGQATGQAAGMIGANRKVTGSTFIASTDSLVLADTTTGAITLTLPRISEYSKMQVWIKRYAGVNTLTVEPRGSDTIDGGASVTVTAAVLLTPIDNSDWHVAVTSA